MKREINFSNISENKKDFTSGRKGLQLVGNDEILGEVTDVKISHIKIESNPRSHFDSEKIRELAESIKDLGLLQPILIRRTAREGVYTLIAGERRLRACKHLGWKALPCIIRSASDLNPARDLLAKLAENEKREGLSDGERAVAYKDAIDAGHSQVEIARHMGISKSAVSQIVKHAQLVSEFPEAMTLETGVAVEIARVKEKKKRRELLNTAVKGGENIRARIRSQKKTSKQFDVESLLNAAVRKVIKAGGTKEQVKSAMQRIYRNWPSHN